MYSRKWTRSGTNLVIFLEALGAQTNLFWCEMKIKKMYLKSNTRQENFRTFEENDIPYYRKLTLHEIKVLEINAT